MKSKELRAKVFSGVMAGLILLTSQSVTVLAGEVPSEGKLETGAYTDINSKSMYTTQESLGKLGIHRMQSGDLDELNKLAKAKRTAPDINEISRYSSDRVNLDSAKTLYGMGTLVDFMNKKQITIGDMEAIMWSFIISQFAEPYQENIQDVLDHPVFKQMLEKDLEIESSPDDTTEDGVSWNEVFKPDTKVADKIKFREIANKIYSNTEYLVLYDSTGMQRVSLNGFLEAQLGDIFYIRDRKAHLNTSDGLNDETVWLNRATILTNYKHTDIQVEDVLIPVYVNTNVTQLMNQINLTSFMKGQTEVKSQDSNETFKPCYESVASKESGTMGTAPMYTDQFGNICVYYNNKMRIVLCNAQNTLFTSRADENYEYHQPITTQLGGAASKESFNVVEVNMFEGASKESTEILSALEQSLKATYSEKVTSDEYYTVKSNESAAVFNKPFITSYTNHIMSGKWNGDTSVYYAGDSVMNDYPKYLQFQTAAAMSKKNQVVLLKPPGVFVTPTVNLGAVTGKDKIYPIARKLKVDTNGVAEESVSGTDWKFDSNKYPYGSVSAVGDKGEYSWDKSYSGNFPNYYINWSWYAKMLGQKAQENFILDYADWENPSVEVPQNNGKNFAVKYADGAIKEYEDGESYPINLKTEVSYKFSQPGANVNHYLPALGVITGQDPGGSSSSEVDGSFKLNPVTQSVIGSMLLTDMINQGSLNNRTQYNKFIYGSSKNATNDKFDYETGEIGSEEKDAKTSERAGAGFAYGSSEGKLIEAGVQKVRNFSMSAVMSASKGDVIPDTFVHSQNADGKVVGDKQYSMTSMLVPTLDWGQHWDLTNEALQETETYTSGLGAQDDKSNIYYVNFATMGDKSDFYLSPGLMLPFNQIITTMKEEDIESLTSPANVGNVPDKVAEWTSDKSSKRYRHAFVDNVVMLLRDNRISDSWVIYGKEDVSLISYVWLNYYLPKSTLARHFISETYETSKIFQNFVTNYNASFMHSNVKHLTDEEIADLNRPDNYTALKNMDGEELSKWTSNTVIMGPYQGLFSKCKDPTADKLEHQGNTDEIKGKFSWKFYPDLSPFPTMVTQSFIETSEGKEEITGKGSDAKFRVRKETNNFVEVDVYDLLMGLYKNTNPDANTLQGAERGASTDLFSKNDIFQGLWQVVKHPGQTLVSVISSLMQYMHGAVSQASFANFFQLNWMFGTTAWQKTTSYYFIIMLSLVAIASIYLFFNMIVDKSQGLTKTIRRWFTSIALCLVPLLIIQSLVKTTDAISKDMLNITLDKSSVAESAAFVKGAANANANFEYSYQLFRDQFESIEDVLCEYGYETPKEYLPGLKTFTYTNRNLQDTIRASGFESSGGSMTKWYDYRGFVPVHRDMYSKDLYYYFYDHMKWQYLAYMSSVDKGNSVGLTERAKEYQFGFSENTSKTVAVPNEESSKGDVLEYLNWVNEQCLDKNNKFIDPDKKDEAKSKAQFIGSLEEIMNLATGGYVIMMNDPNYIYGDSFNKTHNKSYDGYMLEDLFGLGYLMSDVYTTEEKWEPSDELYKYAGWPRFLGSDALKPKSTTDGGKPLRQNTKEFIDSFEQNTKQVPDFIRNTTPRHGRVYGSKLSLMQSTGYDKDLWNGLPMTQLELKLDKLNRDIYARVTEVTKFFPAETPSDTYISLCAMVANFEFTKAFGDQFGLQALEPTGYKAQSVSYDAALRGIFARTPNDLIVSRQLMYMLIDNSGGLGLMPCMLILASDMMAFMLAMIRNVLTLLIFLFSVVLCIFTYMLKQKKRSTIMLGIGTQCFGLVATHFVLATGLNLITRFSVGTGSVWKDSLMALMLLLLISVDCFVHFRLILAIKKDFLNLGGNIFAEKLSGMYAKMKAALDGSATFSNSTINGEINHKQRGGSSEEAVLLAKAARNLSRLDRRIKSNTRGVAGGVAGAIGNAVGLAKLARFSRRAKFREMDLANTTATDEMSADTEILNNTPNGDTEVAIGSDSRFDKGAEISNGSLNEFIVDYASVASRSQEKVNRRTKDLERSSGDAVGVAGKATGEVSGATVNAEATGEVVGGVANKVKSNLSGAEEITARIESSQHDLEPVFRKTARRIKAIGDSSEYEKVSEDAIKAHNGVVESKLDGGVKVYKVHVDSEKDKHKGNRESASNDLNKAGNGSTGSAGSAGSTGAAGAAGAAGADTKMSQERLNKLNSLREKAKQIDLEESRKTA